MSAATDSSRVYLARHGQTAYNLQRRFQGQGAIPLNDVGLAQAAELAERAGELGIAELWTSSLLRARQTAAVVAEHLGLEARADQRLAETDAGDWTERTFAEVAAAEPELFASFIACEADFAFPGGESLIEQSRRVAAALADVERGPLPALVVCHGVAVRVALRARLAGDVEARTEAPVGVANCAVVELPLIAIGDGGST